VNGVGILLIVGILALALALALAASPRCRVAAVPRCRGARAHQLRPTEHLDEATMRELVDGIDLCQAAAEREGTS
jgi:hypothetical protein